MMTLKTTCQRALFLATVLALGMGQTTLAQSITAAPDGTGTIINYNGNTYHITGGTQAGANLFHSFGQFGLQPSEIADFLSNPAISNVVGRVIGGDVSVIEGLIQLSGGNSNLFLVNPAGWVFTEGASVDVPGSFGVTTANRIGFGAGFFNATGENDYAALTGDPTSLIFDSSQPGAILNAADLNVSNGSLWMVGGSVVSTGSLTAPNGTVTLAAFPGQSKVKLSHDGMTLSFFLDALAVDEITPGTPLGMRAVDLPMQLNGSGEVGNANEVVRTENGELWLVGSGLRVEEGDVVVGDRVTAENVDLIASGRVQVADPSEIEGDTTVVRLPDASGRMTLSVIDSRADNPDELLYGGAAGTISKIVERDEDGISVISEQLAEISEDGETVDAVSITAEGHEGNFWLGNAWLRSDSVSEYRDQLIAWREALTDSADLLLYSCFTALGDTGAALMNSLADLTGADVAASTDATGSANYGGDWLLESSTGSIEAGNPFAAGTLAVWDGKLATITVSDFGDSGAGTLRQAFATAAAGDLIQFASAGTVTLTTGEITWATDNLTLDGNSGTVSGNNASRVFNITANNATIQNLTIQNGNVAGNGGAINQPGTGTLTISNSTMSNNAASGAGGGISTAAGTVTISNSTIASNAAGGDGGGLSFSGTAIISNSTLSGNTAGDDGTAIYTNGGTSLTITSSTISNNVGTGAAGLGGGSDGTLSIVGATVNISNSTIANNSVNRSGGLIWTDSSLNISNTTVSGNTAGNSGGAIYSAGGTVTSTNSTIAFNSSGSNGGGIFTTGTVTLNNTIVSNNTAAGAGPDIFGTVTANYSLIQSTAGATISGGNNILGQDPLLEPLADNGGPTQTHAITTSSPAFNAGSNALANAAGLTTDQRNLAARIFGGTVDIGAYELNPEADLSPFTFAELFINPLEDTEHLTDEFLRTNSCQTIPEIELEKDDDEDGEQIAEDLDATDGIDLDEDCLPVNDPDGGGSGAVSAMGQLMERLARRR